MSKSTIIGLILVLLFAVGLVCWQYRIRHVPLVIEPWGLEEQIIDTKSDPGTITEPNFDSIGTADLYLADEGQGIVVEADGYYRFYPYQIIAQHQTVNDTFATRDLLVSYDPLTIRSAVYLRDDIFNHSRSVLDNNFLMSDSESGSLWTQATGKAIVGTLAESQLEPYPFQVMSWDAFKQTYSFGRSLNRDTGYNRDYTEDPYWDYYESNEIWYPLSHFDTRLALKEPVLGYVNEAGQAKAWSVERVEQETLINDQVADQSVLLMNDSNTDVNIIFSRLVENRVLDFVYEGETLLDKETRSVWTFDGRCVSGELTGTKLEQLQLVPSYWFSWVSTFSGTEL